MSEILSMLLKAKIIMYFIAVFVIIFIIRRIKEYYQIKKFFSRFFESFLIINIVDYQIVNFFNKITIEDPKRKDINKIEIDINENNIRIPITGFKNKKILERKIIISNSETKISKATKIYVYKNLNNYVNIYLNNTSDKYFYSEIIFYGDNLSKNLKIENFKYDTFNFKKRIRCILLNIEQKNLFEIIFNNINNDEFQLKIKETLPNYSKTCLLINIFIGIINSNVLIFTEEEKKIILATEEEKNILSELYRKINKNINNEEEINNLYQNCRNKLYLKKELFGTNIESILDYKKNSIIDTFINQGINFLLENGIINEKDKEFIFGYLIFQMFISKEKNSIDESEIKLFYGIIDKMEKNKFGAIDQIKAAVTYVTLYNYNQYVYKLKITKALKDNDIYIKGFNFYKSIIEDLTEESELILIFL